MACKHYSKKHLSLTGQLQSKIKVLLIALHGRGYISEGLTRLCFKVFRLRGA